MPKEYNIVQRDKRAFYGTIPYRRWLAVMEHGEEAERLWLFLMRRARMYGEGVSISAPHTASDLAAATGILRVHVNRAMRVLEDGGYIVVTDNQTDTGEPLPRRGRAASFRIKVTLPTHWLHEYRRGPNTATPCPPRSADPTKYHYVGRVPVDDWREIRAMGVYCAKCYLAIVLTRSLGFDAFTGGALAHLALPRKRVMEALARLREAGWLSDAEVSSATPPRLPRRTAAQIRRAEHRVA